MEDFAEFKKTACELAQWANQDRVEDHDPKWHEFGVLGHVERVFRHAVQIRRLTGIDVIKLALWHDIGKLAKDGRKEKKDKPGEFTFKGHEKKSEDYLRQHRRAEFSEEDLFLVANHGIIRGDNTVEQIVELCSGDNDRLKKLVFICAADTAGKGYTAAQDVERQQLAPKFFELALKAGLGSRIAGLVQQIVLEW